MEQQQLAKDFRGEHVVEALGETGTQADAGESLGRQRVDARAREAG